MSVTKYTFNEGIHGSIHVQYKTVGGAKIIADLDVTLLDQVKLKALDSNCGDVTTYKWHIHTKWTHGSTLTSGLFGQCSLDSAGNHYDPNYACGPNSEYSQQERCKSIMPYYKCTPKTYADNPLACERGDLSGKVGDMEVQNGKISHTWFDPHYPDWSESTPEWNMILHAVCNTSTPRVACATGKTAHPSIFTSSIGQVSGIFFIALIACFVLRRHPTVGRYYPTNLVVVAVLSLLALLVYQDFVSDFTLV